MPMAKGLSSGYLPISATAVASHVVEVLKTGGDFVHGFTYSGHPVAAAVALKNIEIIEREGLVERTGTVTGPHLAKARSEEHTSEIKSLMRISYAVFCFKKTTEREEEQT